MSRRQWETADEQGTIEKQLGKTEIRRIILKIWKWRQAAAFFVPVQELNELRRSAFEQLTEEILRPYRREIPENRACGTGQGWRKSGRKESGRK
ncbi:MAG: DUF3656 domain-containing protein [Clostridium fessum]